MNNSAKMRFYKEISELMTFINNDLEFMTFKSIDRLRVLANKELDVEKIMNKQPNLIHSHKP